MQWWKTIICILLLTPLLILIMIELLNKLRPGSALTFKQYLIAENAVVPEEKVKKEKPKPVDYFNISRRKSMRDMKTDKILKKSFLKKETKNVEQYDVKVFFPRKTKGMLML